LQGGVLTGTGVPNSQISITQESSGPWWASFDDAKLLLHGAHSMRLVFGPEENFWHAAGSMGTWPQIDVQGTVEKAIAQASTSAGVAPENCGALMMHFCVA
jgi:hypothetical protein